MAVWTQDMRPEPNEQVEQRVRAQLKAIDPLLDLRWFPNAFFNSQHNRMEGRYGLVVRWPQSDLRWPLFHNGDIGEPVDLLGWFAEDMQNAESAAVDVDSIENRVLALLASADNERMPWRERMRKSAEHNAKVRQANKDTLADMVHDEASYQFNRVKHNPIVAVSQDIS